MQVLRLWMLVLALVLTGLGTAQVEAAFPTGLRNDDGLPSLAPMLRSITPAVVNISVLAEEPIGGDSLLADPFFRHFFNIPQHKQKRRSAGSGVIVDARKGYVLTNYHVVEQATKIMVTLKDQRQFEAGLVGLDPETDIALLEIPPKELTAIPIGDSDKLEVGDFVVAIGNPFGLGQTVTSGIVSALGRSGLNIEGYEDFIQTDASINPGNSGGSLVNMRGELVGINTAILGPSGGNVGIGFAVPSNMANSVLTQIARSGQVRRGRLGAAAQDLTPDVADALGVAEREGAVVSHVERGSSAQEAGLRPGDLILAVNGHRVRGSSDLRNRIGLTPLGEEVRLSLVREGKPLQLKVKIKSDSAGGVTSGETIARFLTGALFSELGPDHPLYGQIEGVYVAEVERGSRAWRIGLRGGDILYAGNRRPLGSIKALKALAADNQITSLNILRGENSLTLRLK